MREGRLFKIVYYLLDKGQATAPELAERFEVSVRTIYRDIDTLSGAGIPIYAEPGRSGGIHLLPDFVLDKTLLSVQEKQDVLSALQGLNVLDTTYEKDTFEKLSALFNVPSVDWLEVDLSRWGEKPRDNPKFTLLKTAIIHNRCVKILYAGSYETVSERTIQPLKLLYKSKDWYVKAYCQLKQDFRLFKLNRILKTELLEEYFVPVSYPMTEDSNPQINRRIMLCFPKEVAYRVYDEFDTNQITKNERGDLVVTAEMPEDMWLISFLLSFGTQVEIIEPVYLKKIVSEKAKEIYEKNKT